MGAQSHCNCFQDQAENQAANLGRSLEHRNREYWGSCLGDLHCWEGGSLPVEKEAHSEEGGRNQAADFQVDHNWT